MKKIKSICLVALFFAGVLLFSACGKKSANSANPTSNGNTPSPNPSVTIQNFAFSPATVRVTIGGTVTWTNKDGVAHTVTDVGGSFNSGDLPADQTYSMTFNKAGTYSYHCTIHPTMPTATVVVGN
ncbi:MAG TPA: cupredoxin family copper-binding protein [Mucilaginibacter sp.]|jgi:plastocyanin|nr:cupredoxin family copper-binding protein [Mucilaginibacter sp.]